MTVQRLSPGAWQQVRRQPRGPPLLGQRTTAAGPGRPDRRAEEREHRLGPLQP